MEDAEPLWEVSSISVELGVWNQKFTPHDSCLTRAGNRESEVKVLVAQYVCLFVTPWTVAHQAPLSMGFSRPEY